MALCDKGQCKKREGGEGVVGSLKLRLVDSVRDGVSGRYKR